MVDAGAGEAVDVRGVEPAPARAGRDDDGARERVLAVVEVDADQALGPARELDRAVEARQHRVEAARLQRGLARQLGARDAGREADVVLDPGARAGLAAGRPGLGDERPQPLRAAVDGGREPGGPAAEHDEVEALAVDLGAQAEVARDLGGRRVAQHARCADEDRRLLARDLQPVEHRRALVVGVDVVPARPGSGCARAGRAPRRRAANRAGRSAAARRSPFASCHSRRAVIVRRMQLGHLRPRGEHRPQLAALEDDHVGRLVGDALGDRRLAGEGRDVAEERAGVGLGDPDVLAGLAVEQPDAAALDDEERRVALAPARRASRPPRTSAARRARRASRSSPPTGAGTSPRRRGRGTPEPCTARVSPRSPCRLKGWHRPASCEASRHAPVRARSQRRHAARRRPRQPVGRLRRRSCSRSTPGRRSTTSPRSTSAPAPTPRTRTPAASS